MFRSIVFYLFASTSAVIACDDDQISLDFRDAIYTNDIERIERLSEENQVAFESGDRTADETRCLFRHFAKVRPESLGFANAWLEEYPESPYAQISLAWSIYMGSWQVRGEDIARNTYGEALEAFSNMQGRALELSRQAYETRPRLIAASDAIIKLAAPNGQAHLRSQVLDEVMASDPNEGTLSRAVSSITPGWGGRWRDIEITCEVYADKVPDAVTGAARRCKIAGSEAFTQMSYWRSDMLATYDYPELDHLRLGTLVGHGASVEDLNLAYQIMSEDDYLDNTHTYMYDSQASSYGLPLLTHTISLRRKEFATNELIHSPYSLYLLKMLDEGVSESGVSDDGRFTIRLVEKPTREERIEYARRRIGASPYDSKAWTHLASVERGNGVFASVLQEDVYAVNAVVFGNHRPNLLLPYLFNKIQLLEAHEAFISGKYPLEALGNLGPAYFAGVDGVEDFMCPALRAERLLEAVCAGSMDESCEVAPQISQTLASFAKTAEEQNACVTELTAPLEDIIFTPMQLP